MVEMLFGFLFGIVFGSFGNVLIARMPKDQSIISPPSHCPKCQTSLKWYHNIPLLSWLFLRGQCAFCGVPISIRYPLVELITGVIFVGVFWMEGITLYAMVKALIFFLLFVLTMMDIDEKMVPDSLNLLALSLALISTPLLLQNLHHALVIAGGFALLRFYVSYAVKKEAMGEADIMVGGTMGALLGIEGALLGIFLGSLLALPIALYARIKNLEPEIAFIPFLTSGTLIAYFLTPFLGY